MARPKSSGRSLSAASAAARGFVAEPNVLDAPRGFLLAMGGQVSDDLTRGLGESWDIVTDMAIPAENIDEAKVEEARQRAAARLQDKLSDEEVATINASLARSLAQLKVKRRRHV